VKTLDRKVILSGMRAYLLLW